MGPIHPSRRSAIGPWSGIALILVLLVVAVLIAVWAPWGAAGEEQTLLPAETPAPSLMQETAPAEGSSPTPAGPE